MEPMDEYNFNAIKKKLDQICLKSPMLEVAIGSVL